MYSNQPSSGGLAFPSQLPEVVQPSEILPATIQSGPGVSLADRLAGAFVYPNS